MRLFQSIKKLILKKPNTTFNEEPVTSKEEKNQAPTLEHILQELQDCSDLVHRHFPEIATHIIYFGNLVGNEELKRDLLHPLSNVLEHEMDNLLKHSQYQKTTDSKQVIEGLLDGKAAIFYKRAVYLVELYGPVARAIQQSETESIIMGPHDAFVESAGTNISLIRRRVKSPHLKCVKIKVGEVTKTDVYVLYVKDLANAELVQEFINRIKEIEIDSVHDGNMLVQYIDDQPYSIFPQYLTTERPDVVASKLVGGRIIGIVDGSPSAIVAPTTFFEFFSSPDDYYQRFLLGSATRLLRFLAFIITIGFTALYVSVTTYHYEMIPETLLLTLAESRNRVPFPPIYEALVMETTIELLREAGARLPTKIGQTIGIVGGIVIGQAAVQAGLTSNVLIIAVASSAIASFVIPSYLMSASIRLIRFGLIILAGVWGNLGLIIGIAVIIIHMAGLTNLGVSYITPVAPMYGKDWKDVFIRAPFSWIKERSINSVSRNMERNKMRR